MHGIRVSYQDENRTSYDATYLPEVMVEQQWNKIQAVSSALHKGGFKKKVTEEVLNNVTLTRYRSAHREMTYDQYIEFKGLSFGLFLFLCALIYDLLFPFSRDV